MCDDGSCANKKKKCSACKNTQKMKMLGLIHSKSAHKTRKRGIPIWALNARKGGVNVLGKYVG